MTNTRDREILAEEYDAMGFKAAARLLRSNSPEAVEAGVLRAISRARAEAMEEAAMVAEVEPLDGEPSTRAYRHEVGKDIATAIRTLSQESHNG